jgi:CheY-like chemotaxis protein
MADISAANAARKHTPPRILIVENDFLIASLIEEMVTGLGYSVAGIAQTVAEALKGFSDTHFDAVLLDIKLDGQRNSETADVLLQRGIPFAFVSGYDIVDEPLHAHVPMVLKPFSDEQIGAVLLGLVGPGRPDGEAA